MDQWDRPSWGSFQPSWKDTCQMQTPGCICILIFYSAVKYFCPWHVLVAVFAWLPVLPQPFWEKQTKAKQPFPHLWAICCSDSAVCLGLIAIMFLALELTWCFCLSARPMAARKPCRTKSFPGEKPWQVGKGGNLGCASHTELPAEEFLPCPLPITAPASHGCSGSSGCAVTSTAMEKLHLPPTFLQSSRRINVMERQRSKGLKTTTLGSFSLRMVSQSCAQQVPNKSTNGVFILFWIQKWSGESTMGAEESRDKEGVDSIFLGGTFRCGHEGPRGPQMFAHPNCCISCWLPHPRTHLGIFQHRGQVEIAH